ncbi:MAG: hypothetical protein KDB05_03195 [Planctomycetales bacterium]|nr:hypothetical protein [Planctomycetales bacterium]
MRDPQRKRAHQFSLGGLLITITWLAALLAYWKIIVLSFLFVTVLTRSVIAELDLREMLWRLAPIALIGIALGWLLTRLVLAVEKRLSPELSNADDSQSDSTAVRIKRQRFIPFAVLLILALCTLVLNPPRSESDILLVRVGMTENEVRAILGNPDSTSGDDLWFFLVATGDPIVVGFDDSKRVNWLSR